MSEYLDNALEKAQSGERLTGNEGRRVQRDQARRAESLGRIVTPPLRVATGERNRRQTIEETENLESRLRLIRADLSTSAYTEGDAVSAVGSDGKLVSVVQRSDAGTPSTYPTVVKMVNGTKSITLDSTGITMTDSSTGKSFTIAFSALTQNVALRDDDYCDSGVNKFQLHVGSAPHT